MGKVRERDTERTSEREIERAKRIQVQTGNEHRTTSILSLFAFILYNTKNRYEMRNGKICSNITTKANSNIKHCVRSFALVCSSNAEEQQYARGTYLRREMKSRWLKR